jgi:hypothetical protein
MRALLLLVAALPLAAQNAANDAGKTAQTTPASQAAPAPSESVLTGSIDLGYRWLAGPGGSFDTYRSLVDLGSGPKLLGADFTLTDPKHRVFDQIHVRAYSWGDEPYSTFHLDAAKNGLYDFRADYNAFAYFNYLPSYADPLLTRGVTLDQQSFDMRRHTGSFSLDLLPGNWIVPYLAYDSDYNSGLGVSTFVTDADTFPAPATMRDSTNVFRGGVRFERKRFHATLEQGGTTFKDDQSLYRAPGTPNYGDVLTPILGQQLALTSLLAAYGIRGTSIYSKGMFTASPISWMDLHGQFLYSEPNSSVNYQQSDSGNLLLQSQLLFYNSQEFLLSSSAKLPHTTGNFAGEIRPFQGLRITQSWMTDRLHNDGSTSSSQLFATASLSEQMAALLASSLVTNYSQVETDLFFDLTARVTLHGGYRYVWGDANDAILPPEGLAGPESGRLRQNVGIGGVSYRATKKLRIHGEAEGGSSGGAYFRTSLYDYQRVHAQARYQATSNLNLSADFTFLNNRNPLPGVNYDYIASSESLSFAWTPAAAKHLDFQGSYSRSAIYSDIGYLEPETLQSQSSLYRENAHTGTALFDIHLPHTGNVTPMISAGGSFFISSGSRPTRYYQPLAKLWLPVNKHVSWFAEWTYYGYGEPFYLYEDFRAHLATTGIRLIP